jgi:hypothetical protein
LYRVAELIVSSTTVHTRGVEQPHGYRKPISFIAVGG